MKEPLHRTVIILRKTKLEELTLPNKVFTQIHQATRTNYVFSSILTEVERGQNTQL